MFDSICICRRRPSARAMLKPSESSRAMSRRRESGRQARRPRRPTRRHRYRCKSMQLVSKEKARRRARTRTRRSSGAAPTGRRRARARTAKRVTKKEREQKAGLATPAAAGVTLQMFAETGDERSSRDSCQSGFGFSPFPPPASLGGSAASSVSTHMVSAVAAPSWCLAVSCGCEAVSFDQGEEGSSAPILVDSACEVHLADRRIVQKIEIPLVSPRCSSTFVLRADMDYNTTAAQSCSLLARTDESYKESSR